MAKKIQNKDSFQRKYSMITTSGHQVDKGDLIKIAGQHGLTFKFNCFVTNPKNGVEWVDCFELQKGVSGPFRSFYPESVKAVVKRGKRVKRT